LLEEYLTQIDFLEAHIQRASERIEVQMLPFSQELARLQTIPGVKQRVAEGIVSEVGSLLTNFPDAHHLVSWACLCPGADESAGKTRSGKCRKGNGWLRSLLVEAAWAASRTKGTYLASLYHRIARHRGRKRALVAVARTILEISYFILKEGRLYQELGADFYDRLHADRLKHNYIHRLESLGLEVTVSPKAA
jgi:transposase